MRLSNFSAEWETSLCLLCDVVSQEPWVPFCVLFPSQQASSQILLQTPSFTVVPDIGPIVEGYCLIVSNRHLPAISHLTDSELIELQQLRCAVKEAIGHVYGESVLFEHGEATFTQNAGACIDHAHLHIVPTKKDLAMLFKDIKFTQMEQSGLWRQLRSGKGYLYYENQQSEAFFAIVDRCAQQFFRRKLAQATNHGTAWNWRDFIRYADMLNTRDKIEKCISKLAAPLAQSWAIHSAARMTS